MSVIDVEKLLQDISPDSPCGDDLEYDPVFGELERSTQGKPEQQIGDTIIPAEEPSWKDVKRQALELFDRTRDLRVAVHLAHALVHTDGFPGFAEGLALVRGLLERHWDEVHPRLDPEDDNDPTFRTNTIAELCNTMAGYAPGSTLRSVRDAPLVSSRAMGRFGLTDVQIAQGTLPAPSGSDDPPTTAMIDAAFLEADLDSLTGTADALDAAVEAVAAVDSTLTEKVGSSQAPDLSTLKILLGSARGVISEQLSRRGVADSAPPVAGEEAASPAGEAAGPVGAAPPAPPPGEIRSREDVIRALDKACDYFARHEPSSPIPLLLRRAKRLVSKSFMEIVKDLTPDGLSQIQNLSGLESEEEWQEEGG